MNIDKMREGVNFEAKRCSDKLPKDFWPTYSAFANTFGGTIVLGLSEDPADKRKLIATGVENPDSVVDDLWSLLNNPIKVNVNLLLNDDISVEKVDGAGELRPTIAGILMFGSDYMITRELPRYFLDYVEYEDGDEWSDRLTTDTGEWSGNLFDFYTYVSDRLGWGARRPFDLDGVVRVDDSDFLKAEREAVLNAIVHADYNGSGGVRVELRRDSLAVRNPGTFRIPISLAERGGHSDPRNRNVMKMFMLVGLVDRAGSGMHRMIRTCIEQGLEAPSFTESVDPATVEVRMQIVRGASKPPTHDPAVGVTGARVIEYLRTNPDATAEGSGRPGPRGFQEQGSLGPDGPRHGQVRRRTGP